VEEQSYNLTCYVDTAGEVNVGKEQPRERQEGCKKFRHENGKNMFCWKGATRSLIGKKGRKEGGARMLKKTKRNAKGKPT